MKYEHLLGRPFVHEVTDCYSLVRDLYRDNYGIELTNYARPSNWWAQGENLYMKRFAKEGFYVLDVHPKDYRPGDCFMMAIRSPVVNHVGVMVEKNRILHHLYGCLSRTDPFAGIFRNHCMAVVRHHEVSDVRSTTRAYLTPSGIENRPFDGGSSGKGGVHSP